MLGSRESSLFILALCLAAAPVRAQTPLVLTVDDYRSIAEVTAGVSLSGSANAVNDRPACQELALPCVGPPNAPNGAGLAVSTTIYPSEHVGIVAELSIYANPWSSYETNCPVYGPGTPQPCVVEQTNHVRSALAGLKVRTGVIKAGSSHWRLFGQVLAGPQWTDIGPRRRVLQPGVGGDNYLPNGMTVHVEYDYRVTPDERRDLSTHRFLVGFGLPLGSR